MRQAAQVGVAQASASWPFRMVGERVDKSHVRARAYSHALFRRVSTGRSASNFALGAVQHSLVVLDYIYESLTDEIKGAVSCCTMHLRFIL